MVLKYLLVSHARLKSALVTDMSALVEMARRYTGKAHNVLTASMGRGHCESLLLSICDISQLTLSLLMPLPELKRYIWQGVNKYCAMLSK